MARGDDGALPAAIRRHLARSLPDGPMPRQLRLEQEGEMWLTPGGRARRFRAVERFAVERVAFLWEARFPLLGPLALSVRDGYADGAAALEVRLLGLPLQRRSGPETVAGEALRYLAELAWAPYAMRHNRELEWRPLAGDRVEVAARVGGERLAVTLELDAVGDIVRATSSMRLLAAGRGFRSAPWGAHLGGYGSFAGIRVPRFGEAWWDLPQGRYVYWRGRVTALAALDEPFTAGMP